SAPLDLLRKAIAAWDPASVTADPKPLLPRFEYAVWRFLSGWASEGAPGGTAFGSDAAVLLRQVLRWSGGEFRLPGIPEHSRTVLSRAGVQVTPTGALKASPFNPGWMVNDRIDPAQGMEPPPRPARTDLSLPGEQYLVDLGRNTVPGGKPLYTSWQSAAQKE